MSSNLVINGNNSSSVSNSSSNSIHSVIECEISKIFIDEMVLSSQYSDLSLGTNRTPQVTRRAPESAKAIERLVLPHILKKFNQIRRYFIFDHDMKSKQYKLKLGLTKNLLKSLVWVSAQALAGLPVETGRTIQWNNNTGVNKEYYIQLKYNKNNELRLKIQRIDDNGELIIGGQSILTKTCAVHSGKDTILKKGIIAKPLDWHYTIDREHTLMLDLFNSIEEMPQLDDLLIQISPQKTKKPFMPILKPARTVLEKDGVITGLFFERGAIGALIDHLRLPFLDKIQVLKDITAALMILERAQYFHLDFKPDNIVLFRHERKRRAKIIDFGFAEPHFTRDSLQTIGTLPYGSKMYLDKIGLEHGALADKESDLDTINQRTLRRDRVALARIWILLLYPGRYRATERTYYSEWEVNYSSWHKEFERVMNCLHQDPSKYNPGEFYDLGNALELLNEFERLQKLI